MWILDWTTEPVQRLALGRLQAISRIVVSDARDRLEGFFGWSILGVWPLAINASIPSENMTLVMSHEEHITPFKTDVKMPSGMRVR